MEDKTLETDADKIARIEKALEEKDATIKKLTEDNELLSKKINSLKIDGLVKQVEPKVLKEEPEEIEFDFDL
jgi:predicted RNase H-like nuclease (RuvC/YqgF family)